MPPRTGENASIPLHLPRNEPCNTPQGSRSPKPLVGDADKMGHDNDNLNATTSCLEDDGALRRPVRALKHRSGRNTATQIVPNKTPPPTSLRKRGCPENYCLVEFHSLFFRALVAEGFHAFVNNARLVKSICNLPLVACLCQDSNKPAAESDSRPRNNNNNNNMGDDCNSDGNTRPSRGPHGSTNTPKRVVQLIIKGLIIVMAMRRSVIVIHTEWEICVKISLGQQVPAHYFEINQFEGLTSKLLIHRSKCTVVGSANGTVTPTVEYTAALNAKYGVDFFTTPRVHGALSLVSTALAGASVEYDSVRDRATLSAPHAKQGDVVSIGSINVGLKTATTDLLYHALQAARRTKTNSTGLQQPQGQFGRITSQRGENHLLKVLCLNSTSLSPAKCHKLMEFVNSSDHNVILLQEVFPPGDHGSGKSSREKELAGNSHISQHHKLFLANGPRDRGIAIVVHKDLLPTQPADCSLRGACRNVLWVKITCSPAQQAIVASCYLNPSGDKGPSGQTLKLADQARKVVEEVQLLLENHMAPNCDLILGGDFNLSRQNMALHVVDPIMDLLRECGAKGRTLRLQANPTGITFHKKHQIGDQPRDAMALTEDIGVEGGSYIDYILHITSALPVSTTFDVPQRPLIPGVMTQHLPLFFSLHTGPVRERAMAKQASRGPGEPGAGAGYHESITTWLGNDKLVQLLRDNLPIIASLRRSTSKRFLLEDPYSTSDGARWEAARAGIGPGMTWRSTIDQKMLMFLKALFSGASQALDKRKVPLGRP